MDQDTVKLETFIGGSAPENYCRQLHVTDWWTVSKGYFTISSYASYFFLPGLDDERSYHRLLSSTGAYGRRISDQLTTAEILV